MADWDWDLGAVMRSSASTSARPLAAPEDPISLAWTFEPEEDGMIGGMSIGGLSFPNILDKPTSSSGFEELDQLYRPFLLSPDNPSKSFSGEALSNPVPGRNAPTTPRSQSALPEQHPPLQVRQQVLHLSRQYQPAPPAQPPRARKRKNQQKKTVCHVTAENLLSDPWAWRKYGQKPSKGSPYPRNYYRCSSSKGCSARKQVERSVTDPNTFIVTYTGEHTHPRPTHRNSLAGSTRNKFTGALQKAQATSSSDPEDPQDKPSTLSPTTPLTAPIDEDGTVTGQGSMVVEGVTRSDSYEYKEIRESEVGEDEAELDDEDLLIPNIANNMSEDIFLGFHELNNSMPKSRYGFEQNLGPGDNFSPRRRN